MTEPLGSDEWIDFTYGDELPDAPIEVLMSSGKQFYIVSPLREDNWWYPYVLKYRLMACESCDGGSNGNDT